MYIDTPTGLMQAISLDHTQLLSQ